MKRVSYLRLKRDDFLLYISSVFPQRSTRWHAKPSRRLSVDKNKPQRHLICEAFSGFLCKRFSRIAIRRYNLKVFISFLLGISLVSLLTTPATASPQLDPPEKITSTAEAQPTSFASQKTAISLLEAQQRLNNLGYWAGPSDGVYGGKTKNALLAFQKVEGLKVTGQLDTATLQRLTVANRPPAQKASAGHHIEVDVQRQVLFLVRNGQIVYIFNASTGKAESPTPTGGYSIGREIDGIRDAPLGRLYRPKYFNAGIAIHGHTSVPNYPASHGCVRVTNSAMDVIWSSGLAEIYTSVYVY